MIVPPSLVWKIGRFLRRKQLLSIGGGNSKDIFGNFHPAKIGEMIQFDSYFSDGLVKNHQLVVFHDVLSPSYQTTFFVDKVPGEQTAPVTIELLLGCHDRPIHDSDFHSRGVQVGPKLHYTPED